WIVDLQSAGNKTGIIQSIESITSGGGTSIYPGLEQAHEALRTVSATFKHTVLLTDGQSQPGDLPGIVDRMTGDLITVSTVAVGEEACAVLLQEIVRWGLRRYDIPADHHDIPHICTKQTMAAWKSSLIEEPFLPQLLRPNAVVQGIDSDAA